MSVEIFSFKALEIAYTESVQSNCREHVTLYMYLNPNKFSIMKYNINDEKDYSNLRWTMDTVEDYKLVKFIYDKLYYNNSKFKYNEILDLYKDYPELLKMNNQVKQKSI